MNMTKLGLAGIFSLVFVASSWADMPLRGPTASEAAGFDSNTVYAKHLTANEGLCSNPVAKKTPALYKGTVAGDQVVCTQGKSGVNAWGKE